MNTPRRRNITAVRPSEGADDPRARALAYALDLARYRARALDRARDRAFDFARAFDFDFARARASLLDLDRASAFNLVTNLDLVTHRVCDLADDLASASDREVASTDALDRVRINRGARDLADALGIARDCARDFANALGCVGATQGQPGVGRVTPSAARLLAAAARLLPAADRARYAEEYQSELWEIAHAGQPRRRQLHYASRQVVSSLHMRVELLAPRRRKASP